MTIPFINAAMKRINSTKFLISSEDDDRKPLYNARTHHAYLATKRQRNISWSTNKCCRISTVTPRSEERRVGKECASTCSLRCSPFHIQNTKKRTSNIHT